MRYIMNKKIFSLILFLSSVLFVSKCTKVDYINPLDPDGSNYVGADSAGDHDNDGIANIYDSDSPLFIKDGDGPVIKILGDNPASILYTGDSVAFWKKVEELKNDFECYDKMDKNVSKKSVKIETSIYKPKEGNYEIKYTAEDKDGNSTSKTREVIVSVDSKDNNPPYISFTTTIFQLSNDTFNVEKGNTIPYSDLVHAIDFEENANIEFGEGLEMDIKVDVNVVKVYKVKFTATDTSGNSSDTIVYFNIYDEGGSDKPIPVINVNYNKRSMENDDIIRDTIGKLKFNKDLFDYEAFVVVDGETIEIDKDDIDFECNYKSQAGSYTAEFRTTYDGMQAAVTINIKVVSISTDCKQPTIDLIGDSKIVLNVGDKWTEPGFTVKEDGVAIEDPDVTISPTISTTKADSIKVTYTFENDCGNKAEATRTVVVKAATKNTPPKITLKHSKAQDTVAVGTKYSAYKKTDTGNEVEDTEDGDISWSEVEIDTTAFKTSKAGNSVCSLTYSVKDSEGEETKAVRNVVVIESGSSGLLEKYGVPTSSPLPTVRGSFGVPTVEEGTEKPGYPNVKSLQFDWDSQNRTINYSAIGTTDGKPDYNIVIGNKVTHNFASANPKFTLEGTGITGLDGEYYIKYDSESEELIWVEVDGKYAIIWSK